MSTQKIYGFLRQNLIFYIMGFFILFGMKYFYSQADAESLRWILGPTARWVETLSGIPFVYEPGMGYANHGYRFLIAPSCSGVQFLIITAAMLIFSFVHAAADLCQHGNLKSTSEPFVPLPVNNTRRKGTLTRTGKGICWIIISLLLSYLLTIFVNGLRIIAAIYLPSFLERFHVFRGFLTAERLHTMIGAVVYFAALLTIHQLAGLLFRKSDRTDKRQASALILRKCLSPIFWYFFIVLGIPFLNRAYRNGMEKFLGFALLVIFCCGFVLLLYGLAALVYRQLKEKN